MAKDTLKKVIGAANSGKRFPVMSLVRSDPELAATISKLIPDRVNARFDNSGNRDLTPPNVHAFKELSERTGQNAADAETVMQLLPEMELSAQILVSSILSPKDMTTTELTYSVSEGLMAPEVSAAMIARAKTYFEQDYKIKPLLPKMLRDILFRAGSYPVIVVPESSIDEVINGQKQVSMEAFSDTLHSDGSIKSLGLLGPAVKKTPTAERKKPGLSMEAFSAFQPNDQVDGAITLESAFQKPVETFLTVTDNFNLLKIPHINQKIREQRILQAVGSKALESMSYSYGTQSPTYAVNNSAVPSKKLNDREMSALIYKDRQFNYKPISTLKTQEQLNRRTVGNPLIMHLPSESVIPVYVPGCPEQHVGFFVLIDADGHPVSRSENADYYQELSARLNSNGSFPSAMLNRVKQQMTGFDITNRDSLDYTAKAYGDMVEQDLLARLRNGVYGNGVELAKKDEVYRIMLARALAKQHTQLLFVPVELMTYFAFRYTGDGIGKSLLDDMKILNSLRSMLMFANVMASVKNSIGRTQVNLKLDESDPNPQKSIEIMMHEIIRSRQQYFPLGVNSPVDLTDWLQRAGFEFTHEGHPGLPDVKVEFTQKNDSNVKPDTELEESLRKRAIMATGLSPEVVDASFQAEFATSIVTNNILLSKRVMTIQDQFTPLLADHLRKCMMNSEQLMNDLRDLLISQWDKLNVEETDEGKQIIEAAKSGPGTSQHKAEIEMAKRRIVDQYLSEFIMNFNVELPRPNSVTLENQLVAMETYAKAIDAALDAYINETFFTSETGGDVANQVSMAKAAIKAYFLRQWMSENGVMTELSHLTNVGPDGKPMIDIMEIQRNHIEGLTKTLTKFMVDLQPVKDAADTVLQAKVGEMEAAPAPESSSSDDGGGNDGFDFGTGSFDAGGDDLFGDQNTGGDDNQQQNSEGNDNADQQTSNEEAGKGEDKAAGAENPEGDGNTNAKPDEGGEPKAE
jgi:hypothetical protein